MKRKTIILDRDGTINVDVHYLADPAKVALEEGAAEGLKKLSDAGYRLVVATNQSGVARGMISPGALPLINIQLAMLLAKRGVRLDGIYVCPHAPEDECACRKPAIGLVEAALKDYAFDPHESYVVGDKEADLDLAINIGAKGILVRTGHGRDTENSGAGAKAVYVADNLLDASAFILESAAE